MQPLINLFDYERLAKARMMSMVFDYYAGGAMDEITLKANHRAYDEISLRYRVLAGVRHVLELLRTEFDLAMALCGCRNVVEITRDLIA